MWTKWHAATQVAELEQDQIPYKVLTNPRNLITVKPLMGIHVGRRGLVTKEANSVLFSGFRFNVSETVTGIELELNTLRLGRIQDRTIQLYYQELIGKNQFNLSAEDLQVYGGENDMWGLEEAVPWSSPNFGVVVDLQPHQTIPSGNLATIYTVRLRLNIIE